VSPACPSELAVDTRSKITTKGSKRKEVVETGENGRGVSADVNAMRKMGSRPT
jgi:hypothetical protein